MRVSSAALFVALATAIPTAVAGAQQVAVSRFHAPRTISDSAAAAFRHVPAFARAPSRVARASRGRIAGQIAGGILGAALVGLAAWKVLDDPEGSDRRVKGDDGYTPNANTAYAVGSFVGSTAMVYLIGRGDGSHGSLAATAIGAAVPTVPIALGRHEPYLPILGAVLGAPLQALGGTVGYQRTRRNAPSR